MNSQENIPLPEASNPIGIGPEKSNLAEAEDKDFKIVRNMVQYLKEVMNKCLTKDCENTKS